MSGNNWRMVDTVYKVNKFVFFIEWLLIFICNFHHFIIQQMGIEERKKGNSMYVTERGALWWTSPTLPQMRETPDTILAAVCSRGVVQLGSSIHVLFLKMHSALNGNSFMTSCVQLKNKRVSHLGLIFWREDVDC